MKSFTAEKNRKVSEEISDFYGGLPYSLLMKLFRKKDVKVNGVRVSGDVLVAKGDAIDVYYDGEGRRESLPLKVLFADENLLALYKPKGIETGEFAGRVSLSYPTARPVHRLDRNTDGILLFALNDASEKELVKGFRDRSFGKFYLAEVYGRTEKDGETLHAWLRKDAENSLVRIYDRKAEGAVPITTVYKTIKRGSETSLLEVELVTGRTHQIRAHLAHVGHFVLGDGKYGKESVNRKFGAKVQRLTAYRVCLRFAKDSPLSYLDGKELILPQEERNI